MLPSHPSTAYNFIRVNERSVCCWVCRNQGDIGVKAFRGWALSDPHWLSNGAVNTVTGAFFPCWYAQSSAITPTHTSVQWAQIDICHNNSLVTFNGLKRGVQCNWTSGRGHNAATHQTQPGEKKERPLQNFTYKQKPYWHMGCQVDEHVARLPHKPISHQ